MGRIQRKLIYPTKNIHIQDKKCNKVQKTISNIDIWQMLRRQNRKYAMSSWFLDTRGLTAWFGSAISNCLNTYCTEHISLVF